MGHTEDVLDLRWSASSKFIVSAGMDKRIFVWNVEKKYHVKVLDEHEKFVQGIAVDLRFEHIISCSNDRTAKVWKAIKTKKSETEFYCKKSLKRYDPQRVDDEDNPEQKNGFRIFADESVPTFFRRPDTSPDGELFLLPAGIWQKHSEARPEYCCFLYRKNFLEKPSFMIPTSGEPALICKFCPKLFRKKDEKTGLFQQPYYMVFAVATSSAVLLFSTERLQPLYGMGNYDYAALTDLTWRGADMLGISSSDGYCSFMVFEKGELGEIYEPTGDLANLMKVAEYVPPVQPKQEPNTSQERVEYRETEGGMKKKRIIPKKVADI
jgi:chromatin assembly factor 1 subunit B